jgi:hypothetical protein
MENGKSSRLLPLPSATAFRLLPSAFRLLPLPSAFCLLLASYLCLLVSPTVRAGTPTTTA